MGCENIVVERALCDVVAPLKYGNINKSAFTSKICYSGAYYMHFFYSFTVRRLELLSCGIKDDLVFKQCRMYFSKVGMKMSFCRAI